MKTGLLSFFALLLCVSSLSAQRIQGKLREAGGGAAAYATVTLHQASDSALVKGALSGEEGEFEIRDVAAGAYFVKANLIGSGNAQTAVFQFDGNSLTLEPVQLQGAEQALSEVTVTARRPAVEIKADKTVLNVEGTVNSTGLNALELLRKAPGVTVDNNDNVSVKGKNAVKVMIDGRDVPLDGKELAALMKSTQASDVSSIEIISNPSAKYDASGNAGIINIRLKKNKSFGTNGTVGAEGVYGESPKGGINLSLNNRGKKASFYGSYSNNFGDWHNTNNFIRIQNGMQFDQKAKTYDRNARNTFRTGADWFISDKHTVGLLVNGNFNIADWGSDSRTNISTELFPNIIDTLLVAGNTIDGYRRNMGGNVNYRFADTSGHTLNIDIDRAGYRITGESYQPNLYFSPDGNEKYREKIYRNSTPTNIDIASIKSDYEQPLWKGNFGTGFKVVKVDTDNTFDFYNVINGENVKDLGVSNRFVYKERTIAAYVNYNRNFGKKWNVQTGLRMENTDYDGDLIADTPQNGEHVTNNYTEFFPSAAVTYTINKKLGLNATYSRRIDRPSYQDLNPFEMKLDELTYQKGNPMLRPQFTNSFEISPTFQGYPVLTLGYSRTKDVFTQILDTTDIRSTFITQANIADQTNYSLSVNVPTPIAKWWEGMISFTGWNSRFSSKFREGFEFEQQYSAFNLYAEQTVKLPKGISLQVSGWYNSRAFWGTLRSNAQGAMDVGIQKKILNNKGDLRIRFGDVLNTAQWSGENIFSPGLKMFANGDWESRTVTVNFSYRFGSSEIKNARQRKTGLEDEKRRVKS